MTKNIVLQVAIKAVIVHDGKLLILRESAKHDTNTNAGRYLLPGGRIEPGEPFNKALDREVYEETGMRVEQLYPILIGEWRPVVKGVPHQIVGTFIVCNASNSNVRLSEEHDGYEWIKPEDYQAYNILAPDCDAVAKYALSMH